MPDDTVNATSEALLGNFDPGELSLLDGFYTIKLKTIDGIVKELKIPRMDLKNKIKFQRLVAKKADEINKMATVDVNSLDFNLDILDSLMSIIFGDAYSSNKADINDFYPMELINLCIAILHREKLIGTSQIDTPKENDAENPTQG